MRMHPLLLLSRHASLSQQTAKTYAWNQAQLPKGHAEGNNECDELSTLSLRISRPFKRQRKGRERELEAPRNKWKVISMNNAGRPARSSVSISPSSPGGDDERKLPYFRAISKKQKNMPRRASWKKLYIEIGLYSCALCSPELRCPSLPYLKKEIFLKCSWVKLTMY